MMYLIQGGLMSAAMDTQNTETTKEAKLQRVLDASKAIAKEDAMIYTDTDSAKILEELRAALKALVE